MLLSRARTSTIVAVAAAAFVMGTAGANGAPQPPLSQDYIVVQRAVPGGTARLSERAPTLAEQGFDVLPVPPGESAAEYAREVEQLPGIISAQPDARVSAAAIPNDTYYSQDQSGYYASIHAPEAWDLSVGRREIVVAILDSGADLAHPDLAPQLWTNNLEIAGNNADDDGNGCIDDVHGCRITQVNPANQALCGYSAADARRTGAVMDDNGRPGSAFHSHGTMVAGIVGATGNNGSGVSGVAWNVNLMIVKVLDCGTSGGGTPGGYMSDVAAGIDYARIMGADIINLSLASEPGDTTADSSALRAAIAAAEQDGVIVVTAAGNNGSKNDPRPGYPAAYTQYPNLLAIGASDWTANNTWATYSSYGPSIDFAAPGNKITSTVRTDISPALPYGKPDQGTSFASPLVSGMFALMMSRNSRLDYTAYIEMARGSATQAAPAAHGQNWAGAGIINVGGAVERVPMLITGSAQRDWVDVPAGTAIEARIEGTHCGQARTTSLGPVSRFEVLVDPAAVTPGCGVPGKQVELYVGGTRAEGAFPWGNATQELVYPGQSVTTITPPPGPLVVQPLSTGWNNVAHLDPDGPLPAAVSYLPSQWSALYAWSPWESLFLRALKNAPDFVQSISSLKRYDAYWVFTTAATNAASVNPQPSPDRALALAPGWNNIVYTGASREASDALSSIEGKFTVVYHYDNATATWQSYIPGLSRSLNSLGGLLTLQVYWLYVTEPATLVMD